MLLNAQRGGPGATKVGVKKGRNIGEGQGRRQGERGTEKDWCNKGGRLIHLQGQL